MGRIDRSGGQDATMERRHINAMLRHVADYELVKARAHSKYITVKMFYKDCGLCKQNFLKYYKRYVDSGRKEFAFIPHKTGRKYQDIVKYTPEVIEKVRFLRESAYNKYDISALLKERFKIELLPTSVYRLMKKLGINKLNPVLKEEKRKIIKMRCGELGHIDVHYVTKGTVQETGNKKLYILGLIDDYSRVCWLDVIESIKAIDVTFKTMELFTILHKRYGIEFKEMMSDNGSEFRGSIDHPFEKMLNFFEIKHTYTQPFRPQTNGKIERFWKTLENELLSGEQFDSLESFRQHLRGYAIYYNEHRMHQGVGLKKPAEMAAMKEMSF